MLPSVLPRLGTDLAVRRFPGVWKPLFLRLLSRDRTPSLPLLSLFFFFCLLYSFLPPFEDLGCFSGCLMPSVSIQKLFCGIYLAFKCSFDEFVGEKVFSLSYSSAIFKDQVTIFLGSLFCSIDLFVYSFWQYHTVLIIIALSCF